MLSIAGFYEKMPLMIVPISIYFVGIFLNWFGFYRVTLAAFDESAMNGYLSIFVPLYVLFYGATRWSNNKTNMIVGIVGIGITILALIIGGVMLGSSAIHVPHFKDMCPPPQL